jgi:hypothetical protein
MTLIVFVSEGLSFFLGNRVLTSEKNIMDPPVIAKPGAARITTVV